MADEVDVFGGPGATGEGRPRLLLGALVGLAFLGGVGAGVVGSHALLRPAAPARAEPPEKRPGPPVPGGFLLHRLAHELELGEADVTAVRAVYDRSRTRFEGVLDEMRPRLDQIRTDINDEVRAALPEAKREAFDRFLADCEKADRERRGEPGRRRGGPDGRGPGGPGGEGRVDRDAPGGRPERGDGRGRGEPGRRRPRPGDDGGQAFDGEGWGARWRGGDPRGRAAEPDAEGGEEAPLGPVAPAGTAPASTAPTSTVPLVPAAPPHDAPEVPAPGDAPAASGSSG